MRRRLWGVAWAMVVVVMALAPAGVMAQTTTLADGDLYTGASPSIEQVDARNDHRNGNAVLTTISWSTVTQADGYQLEGVPSGTTLETGCEESGTRVECKGSPLVASIVGAGSIFVRVRAFVSNTGSAAREITVDGRTLSIPASATVYSQWSPYAQLLYERQVASTAFDGETAAKPKWGEDQVGLRETTEDVLLIFGLQATDILLLVGWAGLSLGAAAFVSSAASTNGAGSVVAGGLIGTGVWLAGPLWLGIPWEYTLFPLALAVVAALMVGKSRLE